MKHAALELEKDLDSLGLLEKAREIYSELGTRAALSYVKSSYRLLSKVYHPDLNPENKERAQLIQQRLNRVSRRIGELTDDQLLELISKGAGADREGKQRILVVEDEAGRQEIFRDILLMEGYEVKVASNGESGYRLFSRFNPDLVFTDVVLPKMSGFHLVRKIREVAPGTKVIYISGFFGLSGVKQELDEEISKYGYRTLAKPFKTSEMLDIVRGYLDAPAGVNVFV